MNRKEYYDDIEAEITTVVSTRTKVVRYIWIALLIVYIISPIDFFPVPDFIIFPGFLDDLVAIFGLYKIFKMTYLDDKKLFKKMAFIFSIYTVLVVIITITIFSIFFMGK